MVRPQYRATHGCHPSRQEQEKERDVGNTRPPPSAWPLGFKAHRGARPLHRRARLATPFRSPAYTDSGSVSGSFLVDQAGSPHLDAVDVTCFWRALSSSVAVWKKIATYASPCAALTTGFHPAIGLDYVQKRCCKPVATTHATDVRSSISLSVPIVPWIPRPSGPGCSSKRCESHRRRDTHRSCTGHPPTVVVVVVVVCGVKRARPASPLFFDAPIAMSGSSPRSNCRRWCAFAERPRLCGKVRGIVGCYSPPGPVLLLCEEGYQERGREGGLLPRTHASTLVSLPPQSVALHFSVVVSGLQVRDGDEVGEG